MFVSRDIKKIISNNLFKGKVIIIYGARRVGKTVLSKSLLEENKEGAYYNCELLQNKLLLETTNSEKLKDIIGNNKMIVLDEAQSVQNIGLILKVLVDTFPDVQVIATGSSSFDLSNKLSEPLTGRTRQFILYPFSINEAAQLYSRPEISARIESFMRFGFYPDVISKGEEEAMEELNEITSSYLYKDILQHQNIKKPELVVNLLRAIALQIGSEVSVHELAKLLKQNSHTITRYIEILEKSFVIFRLPAFSRNLRKEISKNQKIYFYDLGIRNSLIQNFNPLSMRSDIGGLWENLCIIERLKLLENNRKFVNRYFWRTYDQKEIDYIEEYEGVLHNYEFKFGSHRKAKMPKEFLSTYPDSVFSTITPDNFGSFLEI
jgi:uncharacterized protein